MRTGLAILLLLFPATFSSGQGKKPAQKKGGPRLLLAWPLGAPVGKTTKVTLRGLNLDQTKEVRATGKAAVKLLKKSAAPVPAQQDANKIGDTQIEVELTIPADAKEERIEFTAVAPAGESKPHPILVDRVPVVQEKEPNEGFKQSQLLRVGDTVEGRIERPQDVDVYRFEAKAGQKISIEVMAARLGSALDAFLTLYDRGGQVVETKEGDEGKAKIDLTLRKGGTYFIAVTDANDQGGPAHGYRLTIRGK